MKKTRNAVKSTFLVFFFFSSEIFFCMDVPVTPFNVTDEHIKLIASSKYISLDQTIKQIFKNYFL
jgi:hypothetical protein